MKKLLFLILFLQFLVVRISGQACCTAGTPLLGSLESATAGDGNLLFALSYHRNTLKDVYDGTNRLSDNLRERLTQSILLEVNYGLSKRITITGLLSFVEQERKINAFNGENKISASGLGDALILLKYNLLTLDIINRTELSVGGGVKFPTGSSDLVSNGILLPADMQPGTGSWDVVFWSHFSQGFNRSPLALIANASAKINGENKRYGENQDGYKFGNEYFLEAGGSYQTDGLMDYSLMLRFRRQDFDQFAKTKLENTGGNWMYLIPGINFKFTKEITTRISGQFPVYTKVNGTQLATSYLLSLSFFYSLENL